jgi:hypothetical protein
MQLTASDVQFIANHIKYKDWRLVVHTAPMSIQWSWSAPCTVNGGGPQPWTSRRWLIEPDATPEVVVKTAFAAAKMAEEHECAENFLFDGVRLFDPHRSVL